MNGNNKSGKTKCNLWIWLQSWKEQETSLLGLQGHIAHDTQEKHEGAMK